MRRREPGCTAGGTEREQEGVGCRVWNVRDFGMGFRAHRTARRRGVPLEGRNVSRVWVCVERVRCVCDDKDFKMKFGAREPLGSGV